MSGSRLMTGALVLKLFPGITTRVSGVPDLFVCVSINLYTPMLSLKGCRASHPEVGSLKVSGLTLSPCSSQENSRNSDKQ